MSHIGYSNRIQTIAAENSRHLSCSSLTASHAPHAPGDISRKDRLESEVISSAVRIPRSFIRPDHLTGLLLISGYACRVALFGGSTSQSPSKLRSQPVMWSYRQGSIARGE
jgi:hypothetical protein